MLVDIENIAQSLDVRETTNDMVKMKFRGNVKRKEEPTDLESFLPEMYKIYIKTWGCSHNNSDSEYMAGLLAKNGYLVSLGGSCGDACDDACDDEQIKNNNFTKNEADVWILNSCTVKNPAEDHFRNMVEQATKNNKKIVVAGCVPQGQPKSTYLKNVSVIGVHQIDRVVEVVEETIKGGSVRLFGKKREAGKRLGGASLSLPKIRKNPRIEILPINTGCLNACTYCKTKHARGDLGSYPMSEIIDRVKQTFDEGCKEIWLTSEDLGAYGIDLDTNIADLLEEMVEHIPEGCMLRLGMTNPPYILSHVDRIAKVLQHPRVYSFLHVPVQSGSDNVLGEMRREYTQEDFCTVVDTLNNALGPENVTIATDIICGFPTETDEDFKETYELVKKYKFNVLYTNQFFPRPGTPAAKMERVATTAEVKTRTKAIHELFNSYQRYSNRIGDEFNVLITEYSTDNVYFVGHSKAYEQVLVPFKPKLMGKVCKVRIVDYSKHSMNAIVIEENVKDVVMPTKVESILKNSIVQKFSQFFEGKSRHDKISFVVFICLAVVIISRVIFVLYNKV